MNYDLQEASLYLFKDFYKYGFKLKVVEKEEILF